MQKFLMALTAISALAVSSSAQAAYIFGSETFNRNALIPDGSADNLNTITQFTTFVVQTGAGTGAFGSLVGTYILDNSPLDPTAAFLKTYKMGSDAFGWFQATDGAQTKNSGPDQFGNYSREFSFIGSFTPGTAFTGLSGAPASLIISMNQAGSGTGDERLIGVTATLSVPRQQDPPPQGTVTPEPATIAMFGTMCIPLALGAFRRRQKAAQAAV